MDEKEFNLSEKRRMLREFVLERKISGYNKNFLSLNPNYIYPAKDVKEFIRLERKIYEKAVMEDWSFDMLDKELNKLAGRRLI